MIDSRLRPGPKTMLVESVFNIRQVASDTASKSSSEREGVAEEDIPDECLAGNHVGTKLRTTRKLSDGTRLSSCTACMAPPKHRYNSDKTIVCVQ